jgi:hypothetical protein
MFIRTKCATPFDKKSIKYYWSEIRQIIKGRKSGKYIYSYVSRSYGGLESSYFQKAGSKLVRKFNSFDYKKRCSPPGAEYLLSPASGQAKVERAIQEKYFPTDYNFFQVHFLLIKCV